MVVTKRCNLNWTWLCPAWPSNVNKGIPHLDNDSHAGISIYKGQSKLNIITAMLRIPMPHFDQQCYSTNIANGNSLESHFLVDIVDFYLIMPLKYEFSSKGHYDCQLWWNQKQHCFIRQIKCSGKPVGHALASVDWMEKHIFQAINNFYLWKMSTPQQLIMPLICGFLLKCYGKINIIFCLHVCVWSFESSKFKCVAHIPVCIRAQLNEAVRRSRKQQEAA